MTPQAGALMRLFSITKRMSDDESLSSEIRRQATDCWLNHDIGELRQLVEAMPVGTAYREELVAALAAAWNAGE